MEASWTKLPKKTCTELETDIKCCVHAGGVLRKSASRAMFDTFSPWRQGYFDQPHGPQLPEANFTTSSSSCGSKTLASKPRNSPSLQCFYLLVFWLPPWVTRNLNPVSICLSIFYVAGYLLFLVFGFQRFIGMAEGIPLRPIGVVCFCHALALFMLVNFIVIGSIFIPFPHHRRLIENFQPTFKSVVMISLLQVPLLLCLMCKLSWHFHHFISSPVRSQPICFILACFFHGYLRSALNGLWLFLVLFLVECLDSWRALPYLEQLRQLQWLNSEIGVLMAFMVGTTVFDATSSMVFYTISPESFSVAVLVHEFFIIGYDVFFNMVTAELSTRIVMQIRSTMYTSIQIQSAEAAQGGYCLEQLELTAHCTTAMPLGIDAAGVFIHNRGFFVSMCSTTLTFLLILYQMSGDVSRRITDGLIMRRQ